MIENQHSARKPGPAEAVLRRFGRWLFSWPVMRRWLFALACLATLTGLFYAVENWRGKQAWERCRRAQEAKGEVLDWNVLIPARVPDEQNIYQAPRMAEWFVKSSLAKAITGESSKSRNTNSPFSLGPRQDAKKDPALLAVVTVVLPNEPLPPGKADAVLRFGDPADREQAVKLLDDIIGPSIEGARAELIVARTREQIKPRHLVVQADTRPAQKALGEFLTRSPGPYQVGAVLRRGAWVIAPAGSNVFHMSLAASVYAAAEQLALSQPAVPDLDLLRQALKRPFARMDSDYQLPFERPIPDFVRLRTVSQMLGQRAQSYLLLGQSEAAWHELALVHDLCRLLNGKPASECPMLVEAMIDVAITGLYTQVIGDGLRLQTWREPELAALQQQLTDVNLLSLVRAAFVAEQAGSIRTFETYSHGELKKLFFSNRDHQDPWEKLKNPTYLLITFAPRGWMYQNMCAMATRAPLIIHSFDLTNNQVLPPKADDIRKQIDTTFSTFSPYTFLAQQATPNFVKATSTTARNQTLVNEAFIACGLERYRLAHGQYPETLEALVPQFAEKLPHDIIGGQPLKYHRTANGRFVLYSIGWNEKDDGGVARDGTTEADWVWP